MRAEVFRRFAAQAQGDARGRGGDANIAAMKLPPPNTACSRPAVLACGSPRRRLTTVVRAHMTG
jgi:hypothetical protein